MATFEYRQAEEVRDAFARQGVKYLFPRQVRGDPAGLPGYDSGRGSVSRQITRKWTGHCPRVGRVRVYAYCRAAIRDRPWQGLRATQNGAVRHRPDFCSRRNRAICGCMAAPCQCRRLSLLPSRRHHPEQRSGWASQGSGVIAAPRCFPRVLAAKKAAILTPGWPLEHSWSQARNGYFAAVMGSSFGASKLLTGWPFSFQTRRTLSAPPAIIVFPSFDAPDAYM